MNATFLIKKAGKAKEKTVYIQFYEKGDKMVFATAFAVDPADWKDGELKGSKNSNLKLKTQLMKFKFFANEFIKIINKKEDRNPTKEELKNLVKRLDTSLDHIEEKNFEDRFEETFYKPRTSNRTVKELFAEFQERTSKKVSQATQNIQSYTLTLVNEFSPNAQIADINSKWGEDFQDFLVEKKKMQNTTANKYIKKLITFFHWCKEKELTEKDFAVYIKTLPAEDPEIIVLNESELDQLERSIDNQGKEIEIGERLEKVRDLFLFGCYTSLRFDDLVKINKSNITSDGDALNVKTQKTGKVVFIPLLPEAKQILNKYKGQLPKISNQKANEYLQELCKLLGMDRIIHNCRMVGQGEKLFNLPLHQTITFHKARKTFITLGLAAGMTPEEVKQISGHTDHKSFMRYVKFNEQQLGNSIMKMSRSARAMKKVKSA